MSAPTSTSSATGTRTWFRPSPSTPTATGARQDRSTERSASSTATRTASGGTATTGEHTLARFSRYAPSQRPSSHTRELTPPTTAPMAPPHHLPQPPRLPRHRRPLQTLGRRPLGRARPALQQPRRHPLGALDPPTTPHQRALRLPHPRRQPLLLRQHKPQPQSRLRDAQLPLPLPLLQHEARRRHAPHVPGPGIL